MNLYRRLFSKAAWCTHATPLLTALLFAPGCAEREGPPKIEHSTSNGDGTGGSSASGASATGGAASDGGSDSGLGGGGSHALAPGCPTYLSGEQQSRPVGPLGEASGLASSRLNDSRLYSHNDSGGQSQAFVLNRQGEMLGSFFIDVPTPTDWEDMAAYLDGEAKPHLLFADIGDNSGQRESVQLVVIPDRDDYSGDAIAAKLHVLTYPDGPHNAEALFVDERDQNAYVMTKASPPRLYVTDLETEQKQWTFIAELETWPTGFIPTAADMRSGEIVVRSLTGALLFQVPEGASVHDALNAEACRIELLTELNAGEAISFDAAQNLFTLTENGDPLIFYKRAED